MEKVIKLDTKNESTLNIFKFVVLQKMAIEYYMTIEDQLEKDFSVLVSSKYKTRFSMPRKEARKMEKLVEDEMKTFKSRSKAYKQKNTQMYEAFEGFRVNEGANIEESIDEIYEFIDKLIVKKD